MIGNGWRLLSTTGCLPVYSIGQNPLVALWFAVKDPAIDNKPCVVWAYFYDETEAIYHTERCDEPFTVDKTYVYFPEHVSPFIQAQSGVFTVHHREGDNNGRFVPFEEVDHADLLLTK